MNSEHQPKLCRFAIRIGITLFVTKSMAKSLLRKQPMANAQKQKIIDPMRKTLREIEFDLWAHELDKRIETQVLISKKLKLLVAPKNG